MSTLLTKLAADFTTQLATSLSVGGTTATLLSQTDDDGNTLPDGNYAFTLDGSSSNKEHIRCVKTGTSLTSIQSLSRQGALTTGVVRAHRIGCSVVITDWAQLKYLTDLLTGTTDLDSADPLKYDGTATISNDAHLATKKYVDDTAIAGSPKATDSVYGISKLSVAATSATDPIAVGTNDTRVPTQDENDALVGTSGTPSSSNKYVTNDDTATAATASKVARRLASGDITVTTTPTNPTDAASKAYVDASSHLFYTGTGAISQTIPALGANSLVKITQTFTVSGTTALTDTITITFGGSTVGTFSYTVANITTLAGEMTGTLIAWVRNNNSTSSQVAGLASSAGTTGTTGGNGFTTGTSSQTSGGTLSIDTTTSKTLATSVTNNSVLTLSSALIEVFNKV